MPIIFVHGVNNRIEDKDYEPRRQVTERFLAKCFENMAINGKKFSQAKAVFPYWGNLATTFAWNMGALPSGEIEALGTNLDQDFIAMAAALHDASPDPDDENPLVSLARRSFPRAVEMVTEIALQNSQGADAAGVAEFIIATQTYAEAFEPPKAPPAWLATVKTDEQFYNQLVNVAKNAASVSDPQALGLVGSIGNILSTGVAKLKQATQAVANKLKDKAGDLADSAGDFASTKVLAKSRRPLNATLGRFFGDVFYYLNGRGDAAHPGGIPKAILEAWDKAIATAPGEPLVVVGHSLGGVISYDLLTHFRPDIKVDLFISVGSQVSHFEELKLFRASQKDIPRTGTPMVPKPANIRHWINVFDEVDIFSYSCKRIFAGVEDFGYDTKTYVIKAHSAYFEQARFYERIKDRVKALPVQ